MQLLKIVLAISLVLSMSLVTPTVAFAAPVDQAGSREFLLSCVYGTVAGTLVGAASLAFTDKPNKNLNRVARGASLGLYAGILLGFYVVYGTSEDDEDPVVLAPAPVLDETTGQMNGGMMVTAFSF